MGNVIHRGKGSFTFVENTIFFDHGLSAKAKGIYCQIRSLENNPEWVFTIKGFASLVRDGADAVSAGIKELESSGYIIRARKRSENGRFLKAEEATWITLDDPAMHGQIAAELKADGYAILSEFTREPPANVEFEPHAAPLGTAGDVPEKGQVGTRTGKPVSGKATSGESAPINYSSHKTLEPDKEPLSCPPDGSAGEARRREKDFKEYRKGEFPEAFERLCAMSIKPVASLKFKRDCHTAWKRRVAQGFSPEQIIDAYAAYAKSFWMRNGDDTTLAKNLARWLEGEGGLTAYSDEPIPPDLLDADGEPLDMAGLPPTRRSRRCGARSRRAAASFAPRWPWTESGRRKSECSPPVRRIDIISATLPPARKGMDAISRYSTSSRRRERNCRSKMRTSRSSPTASTRMGGG